MQNLGAYTDGQTGENDSSDYLYIHFPKLSIPFLTIIRSSWCNFRRTSNIQFLCSLSCSLFDQHILTSNLVFTMGLKYFTHLKRKMLELCLKILISHLKLRCASIYWASFKTWHNNTFDMIKHAIEVGVEQFGTCAPLVCIAAGCSPAETREMHLVLV